jgi:multiple sugar transport system permease protein
MSKMLLIYKDGSAMKPKGSRIAINWTINLVLILFGILMMMPFAWMFSTSLRSPIESFKVPPAWIPTDFKIGNYTRIFSLVPFLTFIWNSLKISLLITAGQLFICSMAAFAFARLRFPGRDTLFMILLSSLMVPIQVTIIPIFVLMKRLGLVDTHASLILPALVSAFGVFLLRQFFLTIPSDLEDAAKIDGAGYFTIYSRIFLPLAGPGLSTLAIFSFNYFWNEFFRPLIFLSTIEKMTIPLGLVFLRGYFGVGSASVILAGISMAIIPVLIAFLLAQRYLIEGITLTGLKG